MPTLKNLAFYLVCVIVLVTPFAVLLGLSVGLAGITAFAIILAIIQDAGRVRVAHLISSICVAAIFGAFVCCTWQAIRPRPDAPPILELLIACAVGLVLGYGLSATIRAAYVDLAAFLSFLWNRGK
jgi:hypothetical protein